MTYTTPRIEKLADYSNALVAVHGVTPVMFGGADGGTSGTNPLKLIIAIDKTSVKSKRCVITSMPTRTVQKLWF